MSNDVIKPRPAAILNSVKRRLIVKHGWNEMQKDTQLNYAGDIGFVKSIHLSKDDKQLNISYSYINDQECVESFSIHTGQADSTYTEDINSNMMSCDVVKIIQNKCLEIIK